MSDFDEDLIGEIVHDQPEDVYDVVSAFKGMATSDQQWWLRKMVEAAPVVALAAVFPDFDAATRVEVGLRFKKLQVDHEAKEMLNTSLYGASEPALVHDLEVVAERLESGLEQRPEPSVAELLYPGRVNAVYGTHTAGKTWLALYMAKLNMEAGGKTLIIDYEDSPVGFADRCRALDVRLAKAARYVAPQGRVNITDLASVIQDEDISLVIIDSAGESLAAGGYDSNSERDVTEWFTLVPDALAALGPAVLLLDHIAKKQDGTPSPVGSFRKSAAITGAQFSMENKVGFSRERSGWSKLTCTKDRNGYFATGEVVGRVDFMPCDGDMQVTLKRGETEAMAVTDRIEIDVLLYVGDRWALDGAQDEDGNDIDGRPDITQIRSGVTGDNTKIREAVDRLVGRGFLDKVVIATSLKRTRDLYKPGSPFQPVPEDA